MEHVPRVLCAYLDGKPVTGSAHAAGRGGLYAGAGHSISDRVLVAAS